MLLPASLVSSKRGGMNADVRRRRLHFLDDQGAAGRAARRRSARCRVASRRSPSRACGRAAPSARTPLRALRRASPATRGRSRARSPDRQRLRVAVLLGSRPGCGDAASGADIATSRSRGRRPLAGWHEPPTALADACCVPIENDVFLPGASVVSESRDVAHQAAAAPAARTHPLAEASAAARAALRVRSAGRAPRLVRALSFALPVAFAFGVPACVVLVRVVELRELREPQRLTHEPIDRLMERVEVGELRRQLTLVQVERRRRNLRYRPRGRRRR